jgi:hypothetical protein
MTDKKNLLEQFEVEEVKEVSGLVDYKPKAKGVVAMTEELYNYIKTSLKGKPLPEQAEKWFAVCDMLISKEVEDIEEARKNADEEYAEALKEAETTEEETETTEEGEDEMAEDKNKKKKEAEAKKKAAEKKKKEAAAKKKAAPKKKVAAKKKAAPKKAAAPKGTPKDTREKDFPIGCKVKYTGKRKGFEGTAEVIGYVQPWPKNQGMKLKLKDGSKKAVRGNSLTVTKK